MKIKSLLTCMMVSLVTILPLPVSYTHLYKNKTTRELYTLGKLNHVHYDKNFDFFKWSLFGQISKNFFLERLAVSVGVRVDGNSYTSGMNNPFKQASPRLSLSYSLSPEWFINANAGRYYQLPSYTTMGYADEQGDLVNKQNGLQYIGTNHYVAGLEYRPDSRTKITLEGFYKTYDHYPVSLLDSIVLANKGTDYVAVGLSLIHILMAAGTSTVLHFTSVQSPDLSNSNFSPLANTTS